MLGWVEANNVYCIPHGIQCSCISWGIGSCDYEGLEVPRLAVRAGHLGKPMAWFLSECEGLRGTSADGVSHSPSLSPKTGED